MHRLRVFMPQPALFTTCVAANQSLVAELIHVLCFTQTASGLLEHAERSSRKGISPWMISSVRRLAPFHPTPFPAPPPPLFGTRRSSPFLPGESLVVAVNATQVRTAAHTHTHTHPRMVHRGVRVPQHEACVCQP